MYSDTPLPACLSPVCLSPFPRPAGFAVLATAALATAEVAEPANNQRQLKNWGYPYGGFGGGGGGGGGSLSQAQAQAQAQAQSRESKRASHQPECVRLAPTTHELGCACCTKLDQAHRPAPVPITHRLRSVKIHPWQETHAPHFALLLLWFCCSGWRIRWWFPVPGTGTGTGTVPELW